MRVWPAREDIRRSDEDGGPNVGVGYLISALFCCVHCTKIYAAHPPNIVTYAAELDTDPQTNKSRRSSYSARSHAVLRLTRYGDWIRCFFVSTGQHLQGLSYGCLSGPPSAEPVISHKSLKAPEIHVAKDEPGQKPV